MFGDKKGVSLLYVLMALVCVGAMGSLVLNMAKKEKSDSSLRYSSELARYGATSGLVLAINFDDADKAGEFTKLLKDWYKIYKGHKSEAPVTDDRMWLKLGADHNDPSKYYKDDNNNGMRYRAKIVNADFSRVSKITDENGILTGNPELSYITIGVQCESIDKSGSRAKNVGFYKIFGFQEDKEDNYPKSALYMGSGIDEINAEMHVKGATFMKGGGNINKTDHIFDGEFRRRGAPFVNPEASWQNREEAVFEGKATFKGAAFFGLMPNVTEAQGRVLFQGGPQIFEDNLGAEANLKFNSASPEIKKSAYFNASVTRNQTSGYLKFLGCPANNPNNNDIELLGYVGSGSNTVQYGFVDWQGIATGLKSLVEDDAACIPSKIEVVSPSEINLYSKLSILPSDPPAIKPVGIDDSRIYFPADKPSNPEVQINYTKVTAINNKVRDITGEDFNAHYDNSGTAKHKDNSGEEWMVIRFKPATGSQPFDTSGTVGFSRKMILIIDAESAPSQNYATKLYKSAAGGISLIIIHNARTEQFGNNHMVRGLILNQGTGRLNLQSGGQNMLVKGAVYSVGSGQFRTEGVKITFEYDDDVLKAISKLGIIKMEDESDGEPELTTINVMGVSAGQLSRLF